MRYYICEYCYKEYEPRRRRIQKFCSSTCRSKNHHARKSECNDDNQIKVPDRIQTKTTKNKVDAMSLPGVGNSAVGNLIADGIKTLLTPQDRKTITKGDLKELTDKLISRYHLIKNLQTRNDGALPYFDVQTNEVIYSLWPLK